MFTSVPTAQDSPHFQNSLMRCCYSFYRQELKWHHTVYKPAGGGHPDFALTNFLWLEFRRHIIDYILSAKSLVRSRFCMVCHCVDCLCHITVWFWLPNQNLSSCCFDQFHKITLLMMVERSQEIEVAPIKQLRQLSGRKKTSLNTGLHNWAHRKKVERNNQCLQKKKFKIANAGS